MQVQGGEAVWTGHLGISQKLQIRFRPPLAQRVWARVWHLVSTPVVHF
jgi:hypothetical protein